MWKMATVSEAELVHVMAQQVPDEAVAVDPLLGSQQNGAKAVVQHASRLVFLGDDEDPEQKPRRLSISCIEELMISPCPLHDLSAIVLPRLSKVDRMEIERWKELVRFVQDGNEFSVQTSMADVIRTNLAVQAKKSQRETQCTCGGCLVVLIGILFLFANM